MASTVLALGEGRQEDSLARSCGIVCWTVLRCAGVAAVSAYLISKTFKLDPVPVRLEAWAIGAVFFAMSILPLLRWARKMEKRALASESTLRKIAEGAENAWVVAQDALNATSDLRQGTRCQVGFHAWGESGDTHTTRHCKRCGDSDTDQAFAATHSLLS